MKTPIGVLGCGSFGFAVATLLAQNSKVIMYCRKEKVADNINSSNTHLNFEIHENISATSTLAELAEQCLIIFPVIPSESFREVIKELAQYVSPKNVIIHATKGLDVEHRKHEFQSTKDLIHTMSQIITQETSVLRVGCMAGPNLAKEILEGQPAACVLASEFHEVINIGKQLLSSDKFYVFGSTDLVGTEVASSYKNIIALASGILHGAGFGKNMQSILITRGLNEMIILGRSIGASDKTYLGVAGIGDLIATSTSENSRNYSFGVRLAKGETIDEILKTSEVVEGVRTLKTIYDLSTEMNLPTPVTSVIYKIVFEKMDLQNAFAMLMKLKEEPSEL